MENKDPALEIMLQLDDRELFILCGKKDSLEFKNRRFSKYCNDKFFWEKRFTNRFGKIAASYKPKDRSWKMHYLKVVSHLGEFSNDPWSFFEFIHWRIDEDPERARLVIGEDLFLNVNDTGSEFMKIFSIEGLHNAYWMLELGKEIILSYPVMNYGYKSYVNKYYKSDTNYTPGKVLQLVYDFYQEPFSTEELDDDTSMEDESKKVDFWGETVNFQGFTDEKGIKILSLF